MDGVPYAVYRFILALGLLVWAAVEIPLEVIRAHNEHEKLYYFVYATNWAFLMYVVSSNVFAIYCAFFNFEKGEFLSSIFVRIFKLSIFMFGL